MPLFVIASEAKVGPYLENSSWGVPAAILQVLKTSVSCLAISP